MHVQSPDPGVNRCVPCWTVIVCVSEEFISGAELVLERMGPMHTHAGKIGVKRILKSSIMLGYVGYYVHPIVIIVINTCIV